jgi:hypothetical protein
MPAEPLEELRQRAADALVAMAVLEAEVAGL